MQFLNQTEIGKHTQKRNVQNDDEAIKSYGGAVKGKIISYNYVFFSSSKSSLVFFKKNFVLTL